MRFPKPGVLFAVDIIPIKTVAFRTFPDAYMPDWIRSIPRVERLDFDILAPGHGCWLKENIAGMYRMVLANRRGN